MRFGPWRKLSTEELIILNHGIEEDTRVPWTASRWNQSVLKETSPGYSLEGLMLKLKLQYFGHLMWKTNSFEKTVVLGKTEGRRRRGRKGWDGWMASSTVRTWVWASSGCWWRTGKPGVLQSMGVTKSQTRLSDWTELNAYIILLKVLSQNLPRVLSSMKNTVISTSVSLVAWWKRIYPPM